MIVATLINIYSCKQKDLRAYTHSVRIPLFFITENTSKNAGLLSLTISLARSMVIKVFTPVNDKAAVAAAVTKTKVNSKDHSNEKSYCTSSIAVIIDNVVLYDAKREKAKETNVDVEIPLNCVPPLGCDG